MSRWSYKEQRRFIEIAKNVKSFEELVERTGRSPLSIKKSAMRLGVNIPKPVAVPRKRRSA